MMQPFKEGAPGNHGSFLKRCDSRPPSLTQSSAVPNNSAASPPPALGLLAVPALFNPASVGPGYYS